MNKGTINSSHVPVLKFTDEKNRRQIYTIPVV